MKYLPNGLPLSSSNTDEIGFLIPLITETDGRDPNNPILVKNENINTTSKIKRPMSDEIFKILFPVLSVLTMDAMNDLIFSGNFDFHV
jgi:hypothetical protein